MDTTPEDKLNKIHEVTRHIGEADFDLYAFMELAVTEVQSLTQETGAVIEIADGDDMVYQAVTGVMDGNINLRLPRKSSISGLCVEKNEVLISEDTETDPRVNLEACRRVGARSLVVAPLVYLRRAIGVLKIISDKPNQFTEQDIKILQEVAGCLGAALGRQIYEDIRKFI